MDYYSQLDAALKSYERHRPYHIMHIDKISERIAWCWKWRKITKEQMEELAERACKIYEGDY